VPRAGRPRRALRCVPFAVVALLLAATVGPAAGAAPIPPVPIPLDRYFLSNLSLPSVAPGGSTHLTFSVGDPARLAAPLTGTVVTFQLYAFNGYPGTGNATLPVGNAPALTNATASGSAVSVSLGTVASGSTVTGAVGVVTASSTPAGTFAIRTAVAFDLNGSPRLLESRGWFSASAWASATELPNGSASLTNASLAMLNVSGIVPETALLVAPNDWPWALGALLAGAFALLGVGAWFYWRRGPGSTAGTA
jgi:hypothetical protein